MQHSSSDPGLGDAAKRYSRPISVYYDGACPVCSREVAFYQRLPAIDSIDWVDVAAADFAAEDLARATALSRLHVRAADGRLVVGVAAFRELWAQLPALRWLNLISRPRLIQKMMEHAYDLFLRWRARTSARQPTELEKSQ